MSFNLPNPSLLGILLVITTHDGPQLLFKYPPNLNEAKQSEDQVLDIDNDDYNASSDDDDEDESNNLEDQWDSRHWNFYSGTKKDLLSFLDDQEKYRQTLQDLRDSNGMIKRQTSDSYLDTSFLNQTMTSSDSHSTHSKTSITPSYMKDNKIIFGIEQDYLIEMLCPPKDMCNSRFEINIDDFIYLGLPIHCYDNGSWRKSDPKNSKKNNLNMFHLVFIMNPPIIERNYRIDEMYHYVTSRLSIVLRHEQLRHEYVWNQVRLISKLKEDFKNLTTTAMNIHLIEKSSLCKLIFDCFNAIRNSNIANLSINNKLRSFQIPVKTEFHSLPESTVPYLPGSYISSTVSMIGKTGLVNVGETTRYGMTNTMSMIMGGNLLSEYQNEGEFNDDQIDEDTESNADDLVYFALLLLDDTETIISDIKAEPNSILANFIRMIKPTESLLKLSQNASNPNQSSQLTINQIKSFAFHLIYWRRARVIHPLNPRSVYIVSPMAPITINMYFDIQSFKRKFPSLPSLPHFLMLLSSPTKRPKLFSSIVPSKDHREVYLEALAWLIRYGYVTQLHTFIWLKVSRKVKMKVEEDLENEISQNTKSKRNQQKKSTISGTDNTSKGIQASLPSSLENDSDIGRDIKSTTNYNPQLLLDDEDDTIVLDPARATTLERKWISKIVHEECKLSSHLTEVFYNLLKYMNGKTSLELLLLKDDISRSDFRKLLIQIEEHIISVKHW